MGTKNRRPPTERDAKSAGKKGRGTKWVIYRKVIGALEKKAVNGRVRLPDANHVLSWLFHLNKKESRELLKELQEAGHIRIVPYNFIELNQRKK